MAVKLSPCFNDQTFDANNVLAAGYKLFTYASGSTTKLTTYTDSTGATPQTNPIIINALGYPTNGQIWLTAGQSYKFVLAAPTDTDPPTSPIKTIDSVTGVNDSSVAVNQWVSSGLTPTYLSATSFSLAGDQTSEFHAGRRLQATTSGGTVYGMILTSAYAAVTTITLLMEAPGVLDAGLSAVSLSLLRNDRLATPSRSASAIAQTQGFRLSLSSGVPVTTSDVTGAATMYLTPYKGNQIGLYTGSEWALRTTAEISLALGTLSSAKPYDVFCYDNAGVPALEFLAWTNDTTRATALVYQDGVLCKSGALTRRYLGTFYTTAATTTEDSAANRYLWNYYNRVARTMKRRDPAASWNYQTAAWRQANASTSNQLNFVVGVAEDQIKSTLSVTASNASPTAAYMAIGYDTVSAPTETQSGGAVAGTGSNFVAVLNMVPSAGRHYLAWLEYALAIGTTTWTSAGTTGSVLTGEVFA